MLAAAFQAEEGAENPPLNAGNNGFLWYEVEGVTPARDRKLEEVRERVVADWKLAEVNERLAAKAEEVRKAVADGKTLDQVATELALTKETKRGIKRDSDDADIGAEGVEAVFGGGQGHVALVASPTGDSQTIMVVTEIFEPADASETAIPENLRQQAARGMADDLLEQLVARLQETFTVTVNNAALQAAVQGAN